MSAMQHILSNLMNKLDLKLKSSMTYIFNIGPQNMVRLILFPVGVQL